MNTYGYLLIFVLATLGVVGLTLGLNALLGPRVTPSAAKLEPFECGAPPIQQRNVRRLSIKYYAIAIFFLLFDLETVLLFIWAGSFGRSFVPRRTTVGSPTLYELQVESYMSFPSGA